MKFVLKRIPYLVLIASLGLQVAVARANDTDPSITSIKLKLELELKLLSKPLTKLDEQYEEQLDALVKKAAARGDLAQALAIRKEKKSPGGETAKNPDLRRMQGVYLKELDQRRATKSAKTVEVYKNYGKAAKELTVALTKENKIEAAKLAQAEVDRATDEIRLLALSSAAGSSLLDVMKSQWTPALWNGKKDWLDRDWSHMQLEASTSGVAVTNTAKVHRVSRINWMRELDLDTDFEFTITTSGSAYELMVIPASTRDRARYIKCPKVNEPTGCSVRCRDRELTFYLDGKESKSLSNHFDEKTLSKIQVGLLLEKGAKLNIHSISFKRLD